MPILPTSGTGSSLTLSGERAGTMGYLAPEYVVEGRIGPLGDVYALGAVLYAILVGRPPIGDLPWPIFVCEARGGRLPPASPTRSGGAPSARGSLPEGDGDQAGRSICHSRRLR